MATSDDSGPSFWTGLRCGTLMSDKRDAADTCLFVIDDMAQVAAVIQGPPREQRPAILIACPHGADWHYPNPDLSGVDDQGLELAAYRHEQKRQCGCFADFRSPSHTKY